MRQLTVAAAVCVAFLGISGCSPDSSGKPPTKDDVKAFQGDPKSPEIQKALRDHLGGGPPQGTAPAPPAGQ